MGNTTSLEPTTTAEVLLPQSSLSIVESNFDIRKLSQYEKVSFIETCIESMNYCEEGKERIIEQNLKNTIQSLFDEMIISSLPIKVLGPKGERTCTKIPCDSFLASIIMRNQSVLCVNLEKATVFRIENTGYYVIEMDVMEILLVNLFKRIVIDPLLKLHSASIRKLKKQELVAFVKQVIYRAQTERRCKAIELLEETQAFENSLVERVFH